MFWLPPVGIPVCVYLIDSVGATDFKSGFQYENGPLIFDG